MTKKAKSLRFWRGALTLLLLSAIGCHHNRVQNVPPASAPSNAATPNLDADSIALVGVSEPQSASLQRGKPQTLTIRLQYTLASRDQAVLQLRLDEFANREGCVPPGYNGGPIETLTPAKKEVPIVRGTHRIEIPIVWPGDTGDGTGGRILGAGTLSFDASMNTEFGYELLRRNFGTEFCMRF